MLAEIIGAGLLLLGLLALLYRLEANGRRQEQNEHMKQVLDDIRRANRARDRVAHDADAAERVRDRFTR